MRSHHRARIIFWNLVLILCALLFLGTLSTETGLSHDHQRVGFAMIASFGARANILHGSLSQIASYLPSEGDEAQHALALLTKQKNLLHCTCSSVDKLVGSFYRLQKDTMTVLNLFYTRVQQNVSLVVRKDSMNKALRRLDDLESLRKSTLEEVTSLERQGHQLLKYSGEDSQVQEAMLSTLARSGSVRRVTDFLSYLDEKNREVTAKQQLLLKKVSCFQGARAAALDLSSKIAVYQAVANKKDLSPHKLELRVAELEGHASGQAVKPDHALNSFLWWIHYSYYDNPGDAAQARARKLKQYGKEAQSIAGSGQLRIEAATETVALAQSSLEKVQIKLDHLAKEVMEMDAEYAAAKWNLRELEKRVEAEKQHFGGISLPALASVKQHMQELPRLLGAQGMDNGGMFKAIKGVLLGQANLLHQLRSFLACADDSCVKTTLPLLRPSFSQSIVDTTFFAKEMSLLLANVHKQMAVCSGSEALTSSQSKTTAVSSSRRASAERTNSYRKKQELQELW